MSLQSRLEMLEGAVKPKPNSRPFEHLNDDELLALLDDELLEAIKQDTSKPNLYDELQHIIKMQGVINER